MEILIKVLQLILSLSILVIFHEFGHFVTAKIFKTRVEKFYLFFNPGFSIFRIKGKETEYGMGWLPLGGYVKIAGMMDESMDKEQMKQPPKPYEFRSKAAWKRLIIMLGGVTVNIILAALIYVVMLSVWGEEYLPSSEVKYGVTVDSLAYEMGLRDGDKILTVDGKKVKNFNEIPSRIILNEADKVEVLRDGKRKEINIPDGFLEKIVQQQNPSFISIRFPYEVAKFVKDSPAKKAGLQKGDKLLAMNGEEMQYFHEYVNKIPQHKNEEITLTVLRDTDTLTYDVYVPESGKIGVYNKNPKQYFDFAEKNYGLFAAIPAGIKKAYEGIGSYLKQLKLIFSPDVKAYKSVGGFITIGDIFPASWNWEAFWSLTAFLSIMLAILNILPIPALDGGHVMFLLYEIVSGRPPGEKFMEYSQIAGMLILLSILVLANGNDIMRLLE
ncbi:MAG: RIP metalloprotease RseP [Bacteroidales bacterium]|nr:RIP metalloprotease RseP [Bacteroidales bacterium]